MAGLLRYAGWGPLGLRPFPGLPFASEMIPRIISGKLAHSQQLTSAVMFMPMRLMSSGAKDASGFPARGDTPA